LESNFTYFALALIAGTGLFILFYSFKSKPQPKTDIIFTEALNAMVKDDKRKAIRLLRDVVKQDSDHVMAYLQLGNIIRDEHPNQAIKIHQSLTVRPGLSVELKVDIHQSLAWDYEQINLLDKAKSEAEQVLKFEKRNTWALQFLLSISEREENWDQAAAWTKQIQKITGKLSENDLARFIVYKGLEKLKNGLTDEAKSFFQKAIKSSNNYGLPYRYLGDVYEQTRDLVKAVENWEAFALRDIESGSQVFGKIESALFDLGRYSEVENFYRRILEADESNFEAIIRLANVLEEKGEDSAALSLVEDVINPDSVDVRGEIMKLKLSLTTSTPVELSHQIDSILEKLSEAKNA
jgi:lipopolysaccharide biosynthesis regulator YciM